MKTNQPTWPGSHAVNVVLDRGGGAKELAEQCINELAYVLDPVNTKTPDQSYRDVEKVARRWLDYQMADRRRRGVEVPAIRTFEVIFFAEKKQQGRRLAVIDVLSGSIRK